MNWLVCSFLLGGRSRDSVISIRSIYLWSKTKESFSLSEITALYFFNISFMGRGCYFVFMKANLSPVESLVLGRVINSHEKEHLQPGWFKILLTLSVFFFLSMTGSQHIISFYNLCPVLFLTLVPVQSWTFLWGNLRTCSQLLIKAAAVVGVWGRGRVWPPPG